MNRALRLTTFLVFITLVVFALQAARTRSASQSDQVSIKDTIRTAVADPAEFAKTRFTGGIGVMLTTDPATGVPLIQNLGGGSPAQKAGLREGDLIFTVNGIATSGQSLAKIAETITGFAVGSVTLTIQRAGSTNLQCVIRRSSWQNLRKLSYNPYD